MNTVARLRCELRTANFVPDRILKRKGEGESKREREREDPRLTIRREEYTREEKREATVGGEDASSCLLLPSPARQSLLLAGPGGGYKVLVCGDIDSLPCLVQGAGRDFASIKIIAPLSLPGVLSYLRPFVDCFTRFA